MGLVITNLVFAAVFATVGIIFLVSRRAAERRQKDRLQQVRDRFAVTVDAMILVTEYNIPPHVALAVNKFEGITPLQVVSVWTHFERTNQLPNWFLAVHYKKRELIEQELQSCR